MDRQRRTPASLERDQKRLTTAPLRERPKYPDLFRTHALQLPTLKGKPLPNLGPRQPPVVREQPPASRDHKRAHKREEKEKQHEHQEIHKRPQTSKGSRSTMKKESEYYEEGEDDLIITSMQDKLELFKKGSKEHHKP